MGKHRTFCVASLWPLGHGSFKTITFECEGNQVYLFRFFSGWFWHTRWTWSAPGSTRAFGATMIWGTSRAILFPNILPSRRHAYIVPCAGCTIFNELSWVKHAWGAAHWTRAVFRLEQVKSSLGRTNWSIRIRMQAEGADCQASDRECRNRYWELLIHLTITAWPGVNPTVEHDKWWGWYNLNCRGHYGPSGGSKQWCCPNKRATNQTSLRKQPCGIVTTWRSYPSWRRQL